MGRPELSSAQGRRVQYGAVHAVNWPLIFWLGVHCDLEVLNSAIGELLWMTGESNSDDLGRRLESLLDRSLATPGDSWFMNMKVPGAQLLVEVQLNRDPGSHRHSSDCRPLR